LEIAAWVIGLATTVGLVGAAGFAGVAGLVLVVGIAAETLSPGESAADAEVSVAFTAVFLAFGSGATVLFADALLAFPADDDVVVEDFTVAVFDAFVFAFGFAVSAFAESVLEVLGVAAFAAVFVAAGLTLFATVFVAFVAGAFAVDFAAVALAFTAVFAGAALVTGAFLGAAAFLVAAAAGLLPVSFLAAAVTLPTADFTPLDFVAVFLVVVVAALGIRSTSQAVRAAPP
jgi:hypothetical protein